MTGVPSVFSVGCVQLSVIPEGGGALLDEELEELEADALDDDELDEDELEDAELDDPVGGFTELPMPLVPAAGEEPSPPPPQAVSTSARPSAAIIALMDARDWPITLPEPIIYGRPGASEGQDLPIARKN